MKKQIISLIICIVLVLTLFSGCNNGTTKEKSTSQLALALNPILLFDNSDSAVAFNDIKNAIVNDQKNSSISSLTETTNWSWAYKQGEDWKNRKVYALEKWRNGDKVSNGQFLAYTFTRQGAISVMPFSIANAKVKTYQNETLPNAALALAIANGEEEALCYKIQQDGVMHLPSSEIVALSSIDGVESEFLKPGTNHTAVVSYILNDRVIWAGQLSSGDTSVTKLVSPEYMDISVKTGDIFFISVKLNATYEGGEDDETVNDTDDTQDDASNETDASGISLMTGYDATFKIVYPANVTTTQKDIINGLRVDMVSVFDADVLISDDSVSEKEYELLIGKTNRSESQAVYKDLESARSNNASDFIIRVVNKKIVIAGKTDYALKLATTYFMKNYCKTDRDVISETLNYVYQPELNTITIDGEDISKYVIRTEKYPSLLSIRAAEALSEYIVSKTGYALNIVSSDTSNNYEILVGLTTASGISSEVFKSNSLDFVGGYGLDDYKVYVKNKKLFIEGGSTYASNLGASKLIEALEKGTKLTNDFTLSGKYNAGEYSLTGEYGYTWGDEFLSTNTTLNRKKWGFEIATKKGPWYSIDDPYYIASVKSLNDADPSNDFGGPWSEKFYDSETGKWCCEEGKVYFGNKVSENYIIKDNAVVLNAKRTENGYTSVNILTKGMMEFRYGILEARVIMGTDNGACSTFWTRSRDGGEWTNEFDLCENFGIDQISPNMHTWAQGGAYHVDHGAKKQITVREHKYPAEGEHFYDTYHYLTMEWTPTKVNFYLDGEIYLSQDITTDNWKAFKENTYLIFGCTAPSSNYTLWNGSSNPGNFLMQAVGAFNANTYIDNVRIYQLDSRQYTLRAKK